MAHVCTVDSTGIHAPTYEDVLTWVEDQYTSIFGSDINIDADTQDGQMLAIFALAIHDANSATVAAYNAFSPSTAQGTGLARVVKINGITKKVPTNSTVDVVLVGVAGSIISSGVVSDTSGNKWDLPATVTIPTEGEITVTATARDSGAVTAAVGAVSIISTPTYGWQSVTNPTAAAPGDPVETDAALRRRQSSSTMLPSTSIADGLRGAILALTGVTSCRVYDNDTNTTDENGIPGHSVSCVVEGGDTAAVADAVYRKKGPGVGTYGSTYSDIVNSSGLTSRIRFQRPTEVLINVEISIVPQTGYTTTVGDQISQAVSDYLNTLTDGEDVSYGRIWTPANLDGESDSKKYKISDVRIARSGDTLGRADLSIAYAERATSSASEVTIVITG